MVLRSLGFYNHFCNELEMGRQFEFCRVCRQNHNQGRGHRYSNKHKQCLERLQKKMLQKVQEIRRCVEMVLPVTNAVLAPHRYKFWCAFCEQEIFEKEPSSSSSSSFAGAEAVRHLAGSNHVQNIKSFWERNGGDFEKQSMYIIEGTDLARWEERSQALRASVGVDDQQPSSNGNEIIVSPQEGSTMASLSRVGLQSPVLGLPHVQVLAFQEAVEGNVHSGAAPPWLKQTYGKEAESLVAGGAASSSSDLLPLSRTQQAKLLKIRNPNRVGAAWADRRRAELAREQGGEILSRESEDTSSWFPSFGRVWQSGPRRDTRKEFEAEKRNSLKSQKARTERGVARKNAKSPRSFEFKPYVGRRQTKEGVLRPRNSEF